MLLSDSKKLQDRVSRKICICYFIIKIYKIEINLKLVNSIFNIEK